MTIGARVTYFADALQQRLSTALVWLGAPIAFLSRTAWPLVDLLIRLWIGKSALVLSVLIATDWTTVVRMAEGAYPIPDLSLGSTALLSQVYWLAAVSLILGLATRVGAAVLLALTVASHTRVAALDLNLFWMALLAYYVLLGADRLSLDRLLSQGLKNSPLPQAGALITLLDATRPALTGIYLREPATCRHRRSRIRWHRLRQSVAAHPGKHHAHRPAELPPVSATALPGCDRRAVTG